MRARATLSRSDVGIHIKRVVNASTPSSLVPAYGSQLKPISLLKATPCRYISIYAPESELTKLRAKTSKTNTRIVADHYDLKSFLEYQSAKGVNTDSTVALGTRYEYLIQRHLQDKLGFSLTRIGGKGDGGIDLIGTWTIPNLSPASSSVSASFTSPPAANTTFRVLIQAKRLSAHRKPMPALMRELEGTLESSSSIQSITQAFQHHLFRKREEYVRQSAAGMNSVLLPEQSPEPEPSNVSSTALPTLAILVTTNPLTDGIRKLMSGSRSNLMYVCMEENVATEQSDTTIPSTSIQQIAWNASAAQAGLEGLDVGMRYADDSADRNSRLNASSTTAAREAILIHDGRPIQFASALHPASA